MKSFAVLICLATVTSTLALPIDMEEDDNSIAPAAGAPKTVMNDFLKITKAPPARVAHPVGSTVELECEAVGSPVPRVQWVHGSGQQLSAFDDAETNVLSESDPTVMTTVRSRLIIDHQNAPERTYTCVATSGSKATYASVVVTKVLRHPSKTKESLNELFSSNSNLFGGLRPARITDYFKSVLAVMGSNLVLPCKTAGRPRGEVTWYDVNDNAISGQEPRFKTLPTGELLISDLKWADMGSFTCKANNGISKDTISTFIYPLRPED